MTSDRDIKALADAISAELVDRGCLVEAGWQALRIMSLPNDAPAIQVEEMRNSFFAGAQHVFGTMMNMMDSGEEPTEQDMRRMSMIHSELEQFIVEFRKRKGLQNGTD